MWTLAPLIILWGQCMGLDDLLASFWRSGELCFLEFSLME
jgi:hypothetical protein